MRIRTAVSMTGALLVILLVLVVEGARGQPSSRAIVLVFVVTALLLLRGWLLLISTARESARRDPLTGVYDQPHLHDQLRRLTAAARQYDEPFALVLMRVPRRHEDEALGRLVGTARELDLVARLDDRRLAVVLARISEPGASEAAERLRAGIRTSATAGVAVWGAETLPPTSSPGPSSCSTPRRSWAETTRAARTRTSSSTAIPASA